MIVDNSALVAILLGEEDGKHFAGALARAASPRMTAASWLEAAIVAGGRSAGRTERDFDELISDAGIEVVPVTHQLARDARAAWRQWGRGNHPAALNFGDCFSYALARERGEPLLFKGEDFARTDVERAP